MAEQNSRVYHLTDGTSQWLVRATNKAQAMSFIVRSASDARSPIRRP